jgi:hypothetical protein
MIGDRHAMDVSSQVVEQLLRTAEGRLGIDHPRLFRTEAAEACIEIFHPGQVLQLGRQVEFFPLDQ